jgi:hypothetical protein
MINFTIRNWALGLKINIAPSLGQGKVALTVPSGSEGFEFMDVFTNLEWGTGAENQKSSFP